MERSDKQAIVQAQLIEVLAQMTRHYLESHGKAEMSSDQNGVNLGVGAPRKQGQGVSHPKRQ
jgi:hypothetical protein